MTNSPIKKILVTFIKIMSLNSEGIGAEVMSHADKTVFLNCFPFYIIIRNRTTGGARIC